MIQASLVSSNGPHAGRQSSATQPSAAAAAAAAVTAERFSWQVGPSFGALFFYLSEPRHAIRLPLNLVIGSVALELENQTVFHHAGHPFTAFSSIARVVGWEIKAEDRLTMLMVDDGTAVLELELAAEVREAGMAAIALEGQLVWLQASLLERYAGRRRIGYVRELKASSTSDLIEWWRALALDVSKYEKPFDLPKGVLVPTGGKTSLDLGAPLAEVDKIKSRSIDKTLLDRYLLRYLVERARAGEATADEPLTMADLMAVPHLNRLTARILRRECKAWAYEGRRLAEPTAHGLFTHALRMLCAQGDVASHRDNATGPERFLAIDVSTLKAPVLATMRLLDERARAVQLAYGRPQPAATAAAAASGASSPSPSPHRIEKILTSLCNSGEGAWQRVTLLRLQDTLETLALEGHVATGHSGEWRRR